MSATKQTIRGLVVHSAGPSDAPITVVFLHYWGGTARTWQRTIQSLHRVNPAVRTISYDQRGWGSSSKPSDDAAAYSIAGLAADVESVLAELDPKPARVILVGHSMGGKVAQLVAARWKRAGVVGGTEVARTDWPKLAGLILVAPAPPSPIILPEEAKQQLLHAYDAPEGIRYVLQNVLTGANETGTPLSDEIIQQVVEDSMSGGDLARQTWPESAMPEDIEAEVAQGVGQAGEVPTLIVVGEFDKVETPAVLKEKVLPKIRGAQLEEIKNAGHLLPLEAYEELGAGHIAGFISRL